MNMFGRRKLKSNNSLGLGQIVKFPSASVYTVPPDVDVSRISTGVEESIRENVVEKSSDSQIEQYLRSLAALNTITRGVVGRTVSVSTTATQIIQSQFPKGYIILNPATLLGFTSTGTILASAARTASGNTQSTSLGVANFRDMHLFLDITAVSGTSPTLELVSQAKDPVSGNWAGVNTIWSGLNSAQTAYANIAGLGLASDFAISWVIGGTTPSFTFSLGYVVKDGLPGTAAGVNKTVYLGDRGVTTTSGFPLLEGQSRSFVVTENTDLWAVASSSLELRIFEL